MDENLEALARQLTDSGAYRVLRRYEKPAEYRPQPADPKVLKRGLYLDVETTGLDPATDKIIELGMVMFEFSSDGLIYRITEEFDQFADPGEPLAEEIVALTGITDDMLSGQSIDAAKVSAMADQANVIVAHNAFFDRRFVERQFEVFERKAWACSMKQSPWREHGIGSAKLDYLAYQFGFFFTGHRAVNDCLAGIHLLAQNWHESDEPVLRALLAEARKPSARVWATNSPFETKDVLKTRGYRWNTGEDGKPRAWYIDVDETEREAEIDFLQREIFRRSTKLTVEKIDAFNRFSDRI